MIMIPIFLLLTLADQHELVLDAMTDPEVQIALISAEVIQVPDGVDPPDFALSLVEAEGLSARDGEGIIVEPERGPMGVAGILSDNGRNVRVFYKKNWKISSSMTVCRIKQETIRLDSVSDSATRWCAAHFGIALPTELARVIISGPRPH